MYHLAVTIHFFPVVMLRLSIFSLRLFVFGYLFLKIPGTCQTLSVHTGGYRITE